MQRNLLFTLLALTVLAAVAEPPVPSWVNACGSWSMEDPIPIWSWKPFGIAGFGHYFVATNFTETLSPDGSHLRNYYNSDTGASLALTGAKGVPQNDQECSSLSVGPLCYESGQFNGTTLNEFFHCGKDNGNATATTYLVFNAEK